MKEKTLEIYYSYNNKDILVGLLFVELNRGKEIYSFEFDNAYLSSGYNFIIDPELSFIKGRQYKVDSSSLYGFLSDLVPDRWGKNLIFRKEKRLAKEENRNPEVLLESDYLLRVNDATRQGAIRIKEEGKDGFLDNSKDPIPSLLFINKLEKLCYDVNGYSDEELKDLFTPGSSLGGARPKAIIYDNDKNLYLAKFAKKDDSYDIPGIEMVTNDLACLVGINVPNRKCIQSSTFNKRSIFLVKRFDRELNKRIGYVSMMALLGAKDGESSDYSYLDILDLIKQYSINVIEDSRELFRRMIFNILIHNGDDHLRNHGFLYKDKGYVLSPVFDINPSIDSNNMTLSIDGFDNSFSLETALKVCNLFCYEQDEATLLINNMINIIKANLENLMNKYHIKDNVLNFLQIID